MIACLNELEDEVNSGVLKDEDGIVVGTAYITRVMGILEKICL